MPVVDVPDVGEVEFPDDMSHEDIASAIQKQDRGPERLKLADEMAKLRHERFLGEQGQALIGAAQDIAKVAAIPATPILNLPRSKGTGVGSGLLNVGANLAEGISAPAYWLLPQAKPLQALVAGQTLGSVPESTVNAIQTLRNPLATPAQKTEALAAPIVSTTVGALITKGANAKDQIKSPSGVPVEQQSVPVDRAAEIQAQERTAQRGGEGEQAVPQPSEVQKVKEPLSVAPAGESPTAPAASAAEVPVAAGTEPAKMEPTPIRTTTQGIAQKWATATDPNAGEIGAINLDPIRELVDKATPYVKDAFQFARDIGKEQLNIAKMDDYRKSVLRWSQRLQASFGEAADAQKDIATRVPSAIRREGITNWIQADGDPTVLANRLSATTDPKLRRGYEAALSLTPEEVAVANDVRNTYRTLGQRGLFYDVLRNFKDNYVTQVWDLKKGPVFSGARTLRDKFRFSKASTFDTFFDGEQAGYKPKTKDISKLLPVYLHEMNQVIAARQLVQDMNQGVASDGRPLTVPTGTGTQVTNPTGSATLITPKSLPADVSDYKTIPNQPALNDWRWKSTDQAGNPVFLKSDLALHPEAYNKLKNVLGKSAIREWYSTPGSMASAIPKTIIRGLDAFNSETKRTMLGLISPFHQVQEGTHAVGHRVNPFWSIPKVDMVNNLGQKDAAQHGLMLNPDRASANQFMEGFRTSGLVSKIPYIGQLADHYSNYLFHEYIPGLKFKTYEAILERNRKVYSPELASGHVSEADVKHLSAEQTNAAYGHLNYTDLARNPTVQHVMQLGLLAPDFLEARARFTGQAIKGIGGQKVGREQLLALATLALAQATTAYTSAKLSGGEWDPKHPFEFHVGNRRYTMRSVPEDISSIINNSRTFINSRISPIIGKGILQYLTRTDYRGQPISAGETTKELIQQPIPISIRGFLGLGRQSLSGWEQLASAVGLRISRYSAANDVFDLAHKWMQSNPDPRVRKRLEVQQHSVFPESEYKPLRNALNDNNVKTAREAYSELLKTKTSSQISRALRHQYPFTGKASDERLFVNSLTPEQKKIYYEAVKERKDVYQKFLNLPK